MPAADDSAGAGASSFLFEHYRFADDRLKGKKFDLRKIVVTARDTARFLLEGVKETSDSVVPLRIATGAAVFIWEAYDV